MVVGGGGEEEAPRVVLEVPGRSLLLPVVVSCRRWWGGDALRGLKSKEGFVSWVVEEQGCWFLGN